LQLIIIGKLLIADVRLINKTSRFTNSDKANVSNCYLFSLVWLDL